MTAMELCKTPRYIKWLSRLAIAGVIGVPVILVLTPWQQSVHGVGRATAFNPIYRTQFIVSPIEGRVKTWHVVEGDRVTTGQKIAELIDNDPLLESRLELEHQALADRRQAAVNRIQQIEIAISNLESSFAIQKALQRTFVQIEQEQLTRANQEQIDAKAVLVATEQNEKRMKELFPRGASEREVELAVRDRVQASARLEGAEANIKLRANAVTAAKDLLERIDKDMLTAVSRENASRESAKADLGSAEAALVQMDVRIARQRAQYIESPCDGIVFRLLANAEMGGLLVRPGERLAMIVPDIKEGLSVASPLDIVVAGAGATALQMELTNAKHPGTVTELFIDGNDLPLVRKGDRVRVQFEGWPAVQFVAIPEAAAGTFGGRVYLIDPAANDKGQFRILVEPDPDEQNDPRKRWPNQEYLRQGVQAQGWVLLDRDENRVTLGWELWRLLNGFPVTRPLETKPSGSKFGPAK
ncbi:HlyD family efflux transporter periplasmic adaptor subunit [soil metagenome]